MTRSRYGRRSFAAGLCAGAMVTGCRPRGGPPTPAEVVAEPGLSVADWTEPDDGAASTANGYEELAGFCDGVAAPSASEYAGRRARVQARMVEQGVELLVVEPGPDMLYLTGVRWGRSERPFLLALTQSGASTWVVPGFEERTAREQLGPDADVRPWQEHEDPFAALPKPESAKATVVVDADARALVYGGVLDGLGLSEEQVRLDSTLVGAVRMRKTAPELARLRRANEATKVALAAAASQTRAGIRQSELAAHVRAAQEAAGLVDVWVLALFGPAASFPHGTREDRELADGDMVLVDTGGALHGYRSDITRTWALGEPSQKAARAWSTVRDAQAAALAAIGPGVRCAEVDAVARKLIAEAGYGTPTGYEVFTHRLGHGIGLQVHEPPYLVPGNDLVLEAGMTMSNEPGIYIAGELGIRIEDIVAVTETGVEVFGPSVDEQASVPVT